jgi:F0F1-type ATP synthase membrane subunit b/b'
MLETIYKFLNRIAAAPLALMLTNPMVVIAGLVIAGVILIFIVSGALFGSCGRKHIEKKIDNIENKIENANAAVEVINQQKANANFETRNAEAQTNAAKENLNRAKNANYSGVSGSELDKMAANYK